MGLYEKHTRTEKEGTLIFHKYTVDGKPVCCAWAGSKNHKQMCCEFLRTFKFGCAFLCAFVEKEIQDNTPVKGCPLWDKENQNGR
jgi:hypothetical protein